MNRGGRGTGRGRGRAGAAAGSSRPASASDNPEANTSRATPSATPTPGRTPSATPGRTPSTSRATRAASTAGRLRPKNVRRDEAERDSLARQEEKKASQRAAEERRAAGRSRFRSKRSRGDAMGARGGMGRGATGSASGPFSSGMGGSSGSGGGWFGGGGGGGGGGGFRSIGGSSRGVKGERGTPGFNTAADRNRETRINADKLHVMEPEEELDSEDEAMHAALSQRSSNVLPMGIYRREHKETGIVVATTAELEAAENAGEEESLWVDGDSSDTQPPPEQPPEEGIWDTGGKKPVVVKKEPDADEPMDLDSKPEISEIPEAKEEKKVEIKVKKAPPQDPEDKRIQNDLNLLASELGSVTITGEDGETRTEGPANKDGRMYLFQFPPLLPPLKQSAAPKPKSKVKAEDDGYSMADAPPANGDSAPVDLTEENEAAEDDPEDSQGFMSSLLSEGGMVGKLNVRKSGKVELDWGGRILEMNPATGMNFLTQAVILEQNDQKPAPGVIGGDSIGMGKIMGRFVLAPVWGEEEDWDVPPEELNIDQAMES